eukprot:1115471-Rhodomonas_salina.2
MHACFAALGARARKRARTLRKAQSRTCFAASSLTACTSRRATNTATMPMGADGRRAPMLFPNAQIPRSMPVWQGWDQRKNEESIVRSYIPKRAATPTAPFVTVIAVCVALVELMRSGCSVVR